MNLLDQTKYYASQSTAPPYSTEGSLTVQTQNCYEMAKYLEPALLWFC